MTPFSWVKHVSVFILLVALHYSVRPFLGARISVDFLVIAVLLTAVYARPGIAALIGFATGAIADSLTPSSFGSGALAMAVVGYTASWLKAAVFGDNVLAQVVFIGAGKLAFDIIYLVAERRLALADLVVQLLVWSPASAVATGLAAVLVVFAFRISMESRR